MDGTLYAVYMPKFLSNYKLLYRTFYVVNLNKHIMYVESERHR